MKKYILAIVFLLCVSWSSAHSFETIKTSDPNRVKVIFGDVEQESVRELLIKIDEKLDLILKEFEPQVAYTEEYLEQIYGIIREIDDDKALEKALRLWDTPIGDEEDVYVDCGDDTDRICLKTGVE